MFDLETLGTLPTSPIVSLAYVKFDLYNLQKYETILNTGRNYIITYNQDQIKRFTIEFETVKWWVKQNAAVAEAIFGPGTPVDVMLEEIKPAFSTCENIWSLGWMDPAILAHTYHACDKSLGYHFRKPSCMRTIAKFTDKEWPDKPKGFVLHNALHDAAYQAYVLQRLVAE